MVIANLESIIYSYVELEELVILKPSNLSAIILQYYTPLPHINTAIMHGHYYTFKYLLSISSPNDDSINEACIWGKLRIAKILYNRGYKPKQYAINFGSEYYDMMLWLYSHNYIANERGIRWICKRGQLRNLQFLYSKGLLINKIDNIAVCNAAEGGHLHIIQFLESVGIMPSTDTIYYASGNGKFEIVKYLIQLGVKPSQICAEYALKKGNMDIAEYLRNYVSQFIPHNNEHWSTYAMYI
jgi:hypothetical protein